MLIESTDKLTIMGGTPARVWTGTTEGGVTCLVFVRQIAVDGAADCAEFERDLAEQLPPAELVPLSRILGD